MRMVDYILRPGFSARLKQPRYSEIDGYIAERQTTARAPSSTFSTKGGVL
jgi:hypothetical protein